MAAKKNNNTFLNLLMGIALGGMITYFIYPIVVPSKQLSKDTARVEQINNLYVFVGSRPVADNSYEVINTFQGDNILDMFNSLGIGKEDIGTVLGNIFRTGSQNVNLYAQLDKLTEQIVNKHPNAQGIIISKEIKKCEVIVFK